MKGIHPATALAVEGVLQLSLLLETFRQAGLYFQDRVTLRIKRTTEETLGLIHVVFGETGITSISAEIAEVSAAKHLRELCQSCGITFTALQSGE